MFNLQIYISDVSGSSTALDDKQNKITANSYLSISDVSGLTTALENVDIGDINISDVINLQIQLNKKQNEFVPLNNIIIDEDNNLYLDQVVTTSDLSTALDDKQNKITDNNYLSISDITG